jgi:GNAT superfamily N-acetyltransferase
MRLKEFAPAGGDDREPNEEEILHRLAAQWWQGDEDPRAERTLASMGWEIGQDEGYDNGGVFVVRAGDINGDSFISWPAEELEQLFEIARIPQGDFGDKDTLYPMATKPKTKPLPGGSRFSYAVNKTSEHRMEIMIFDGDTLAAELDLYATLDPLNTWEVESVVTDPDYRGQGLGKALYGIALSILKLTVEAGEIQTKHGQQMWLMLNSIPGVEVKGYAMTPTDEYRQKRGDTVVDQNATWTRYTFSVEPGTRSMRSTRRGTGIYSSNRVSMIAKWTGQ